MVRSEFVHLGYRFGWYARIRRRGAYVGLLGVLEKAGKAAWDIGKETVSVVGDVAGVFSGVQAVGDLIERIGDRAALEDVAILGGRLAGWAEKVGLNRVLRAADSPILDAGQAAIGAMRLTTGWGDPESGERFGKGGAQFRKAGLKLSLAQPDPGKWSGVGAEAYAGRNAKQRAGTFKLAGADHEVHRIVATEAYQVDFHRDRLDQWSNFLADVGLFTFALGLIPGYGKAAKDTVELAAVIGALGSCSIELYQLSSEVEENTAALTRLLPTYEDVGKSAEHGDRGSRPPDPPRPPTSTNDEPKSKESDQPPPQAPPNPAAPPVPAPYPGGAGPGARGAGAGAGGAAPVMPPVVQRSVPAAAAAPPAGASSPPPAARGAAPAAMGAPAPLSAAPAAAASSVPTGLINQAVQAAVQSAVEKALDEQRREDNQREEKDRDDKERDRKERDRKDGEDKNGEDKNGDGIPDDLQADDVATVGEVDAGRAPIGPAKDSDPAPLARLIAATLDQESFHRADAGASAVGR